MRVTRHTPEHVVFLPGFMCDERLFAPQIRQLDEIGISYDVPVMRNESTFREMATSILQNTPKNFALVGLSMGGIIAQQIVALAPHRVSHLALLNTTPYEDKSLSQRKAHIKRVRNGELETILRDELKPRYLSPSSAKPKIMPLVADMGAQLGLDIFIQQSVALMIRKSQASQLSKISCPTLVLTGTDDRLCPPDIHKKMAQSIKNSELMIVKNCGHLSTLEKPNVVTNALMAHWSYEVDNLIHFPNGEMRSKEDA